MAISEIEINGTAYGAGDVKINILGRTITGISKVSYSTKQEKKNLKGMSRDNLQRGLGNRDHELNLTFKAFEIDAVSRTAPNGDITRIKPFNAVISYLDTEENLIKTDILKYVEFNGEKRDIKGGDTEVEVECEMIVGAIDRNV